jgi:hypothetical protein
MFASLHRFLILALGGWVDTHHSTLGKLHTWKTQARFVFVQYLWMYSYPQSWIFVRAPTKKKKSVQSFRK